MVGKNNLEICDGISEVSLAQLSGQEGRSHFTIDFVLRQFVVSVA